MNECVCLGVWVCARGASVYVHVCSSAGEWGGGCRCVCMGARACVRACACGLFVCVLRTVPCLEQSLPRRFCAVTILSLL